MSYENLEAAFIDLQTVVQQSHLELNTFEMNMTHSQSLESFIFEKTETYSESLRDRLREEYLGLGPLSELMVDHDVTEILINDQKSIWFEKNGRWHGCEDVFLSDLTYRNFYHRICAEGKILTNFDIPKADGRWQDFRVCVVQRPVVQSEYQMSFRRQKPSAWNFKTLQAADWASPEVFIELKKIITQKKNVLIVGPTGSGKTSILNACLKEIEPLERVVILEDTDELAVPNGISTKLLARKDSQKILSDVTLTDLVRLSLRLRPDRVVMGEVRGEEAKDLLMALATGHRGGFGTIHADDARQSLLRLEMLIQLGAPQWNLQAVRQLIQLSLDAILVVHMTNGKRHFHSLSRISSLESFGFTLERVI